MSGHIFYKHRYYGFDDAAYASGRLLEIMGATQSSVSELLADVPKTVSTPELRMDCPENIKFDLVKRVIDSFKKRADSEPFSVIDIDGARVEWEDGWGLVRCSNTQPILVLRFEAQTDTRLKEIRQVVESEIELQRSQMN
jgi:phosphomannomutase/phosphoglucomutase